MSTARTIVTGPPEIVAQTASLDIWDGKYRLKDRRGEPVDRTLDDTHRRVARALADVETTTALREQWFERFLWALRHGAIPAGRIVANAGAAAHKPSTSTINCTVSGTIADSMDDILRKVHEAGLTLKAGSGIGYEFSTLRPRGAYVSGAGAHTSGPLSFMDIYDRMCFTISSAGGRRGAQMATFDIGHPDVLDFINAKREDGRLRQFNLSLLVSDEFMHALAEDADWPLAFPVTEEEARAERLDLADRSEVIWRPWPLSAGYVTDAGLVACHVYRTMKARALWDAVMRSTYEYGEPGVIFSDRVNDENNNWFCEDIRASNPCGEQPLPPYGSCLLGSVNLTRFVRSPFTAEGRFDWEEYREVVRVFTRMLDNVVELHGLPLAAQAEELRRKRRHGMGFLGLGSALAMLRMKYGDSASIAFTEGVTRDMALVGWQVALELAQEKGAAPIMDEVFTIDAAMLRKRPELERDGYSAGDRVSGRVLHARYSRYMQKLAREAPQLIDVLAESGARFTHHTSIAPTGTIALALANNASNGIEPSFAHHYVRNVIRRGKKSKDTLEVYSFELLAYRAFKGSEVISPAELPEYFVDSHDITPRQHVDIQAAAQKWVDSSISKTANVPEDHPFAEFEEIYRYAWEQGLKGCTTFRFNPRAFQGVLVNEADLASTTYRFVLEDGSVVEARGGEQLEYDGETHSAANLYDALKEGYYAKY